MTQTPPDHTRRTVDRLAVRVLAEVFSPRYLGQDLLVAPHLDWTGSTTQASHHWAERLTNLRDVAGDEAFGLVYDQLFDPQSDYARHECLNPFVLLATRPLTMAGLPTGPDGLIVELFGQTASPTARGRGSIEVTDNHIHAGLAFGHRQLLQGLVRQGKSLYRPQANKVTGSSYEDIRAELLREIILADALRFALWVIDSWVQPLPPSGQISPMDYENRARTVLSRFTGDYFTWVFAPAASGNNPPTNFWGRVAQIVSPDKSFDTLSREWNDNQGDAAKLRQALDDPDSTWRPPSDGSPPAGAAAFDPTTAVTKTPLAQLCQRLCQHDTLVDPSPTDNGAIILNRFVVNTLRAAVRLFNGVASCSGRGFAEFQQRTLNANTLRKIIFPEEDQSPDPISAQSPAERECRVESMYQVLDSGLPGFKHVGFELRREIDAADSVDQSVEDILASVTKGWEVASDLMGRVSDGQLHFCSPLSFQRARPDWWSRHWSPEQTEEPAGHPTRDRSADDRTVLPWQQLTYAAQTALAITRASRYYDAARADGEPSFDQVVGSLDVSGVELRHATWPYVAAARWLRDQGMRLHFTAHAGESFERGFSGLRTIGELWLGTGGQPKEAPVQRIGHGLALDQKYRYYIEHQHDDQIRCDQPHRFSEFLLDLCYLYAVLPQMGAAPSAIARCGALLTDLTAPPDGTANTPAPDVWATAFQYLHSGRLIDFFVRKLSNNSHYEAFGRPRGRGAPDARLPAASPYDLILRGEFPLLAGFDPAALKAAIQQLILGRIDTAGYATCQFAVDGNHHPVTHLPLDLEDAIHRFLKSWEARLARYLVNLIRQDGCVIETCPVSNSVITGQTDHGDHPMWAFVHQRLPVSVNSDNPLIFGGFSDHDVDCLTDTWREAAGTRQMTSALKQLKTHRLPYGHAATAPTTATQADQIAQTARRAMEDAHKAHQAAQYPNLSIP